MFGFDICVVGGCGRVGLPLSIAFADKGLNVVIYDSDKRTLKRVCVEYDIAAAQAKIRKAGLPEILAARLERGC